VNDLLDFMMYQIMGEEQAGHVSIQILSVLKKLSISDIPLVAQTYDGANVMSRSTSGVQTRIRDSCGEFIKLKSFQVSVTTGAEGNDICNQGFDMNKTENNKQYWCSSAHHVKTDVTLLLLN